MKNFSRTDLAGELVTPVTLHSDDVCKVREAVLDEETARYYGKSAGRYVTIETTAIADGNEDGKRRVAEALAGSMMSFNPDTERILVVGLGNTRMTADALGAETCAALSAGDGVMCVIPGVPGITGIESFDVVKGVCDRVRPTLVIAVDSLAAASVSRLATVVQLCDTGITPGSGVSNHKRKLSEDTLGVRVIGLGIPLVVYASTIIREYGGNDEGCETLIVTPKEVDIYVKDAADVIAQAIELMREL